MSKATVVLLCVGFAIAGIAAGSKTGESIGGATPIAGSPVASPVGSPNALLGDPVRGELMAGQCLSCHSVDGSDRIGPTWLGLYGTEVEVDGGNRVLADAAYLRESIVEPLAKVVDGYPALMPSFTEALTDADIADLIAYIKTLLD